MFLHFGDGLTRICDMNRSKNFLTFLLRKPIALDFYKNLPIIKQPIPTVLADENLFTDAPDDWHIVVADIINSTEAVNTGRHSDVNFVAAGCLIAALNATKALRVEIPYFFGGDGGTVMVPGEILPKVIAGLNAHKQNSRDNFSLNLRIGSVPVIDVKKAGHKVKIAKIEESPGFNKALVIGNGFKYAEYIIKRTTIHVAEDVLNLEDLNLDGMECKWDKVKPPATEFEVVCFLIDAINEKDQFALYSDILGKLDSIYGAIETRHPITINMLKLKADFNKIKKEMLARYSKWNPFYFLKTWFVSLFGKFYFKYDLKINNLRASDYLSQLISFSEILTIDGRINTIVSGTTDKRRRFLEYLRDLEKRGVIVFGHYVSSASIMTCYVENIHNKHVHFIDGADGGYTEAAKELKPKLASLKAFEKQ